jgi:hypothetical protein
MLFRTILSLSEGRSDSDGKKSFDAKLIASSTPSTSTLRFEPLI